MRTRLTKTQQARLRRRRTTPSPRALLNLPAPSTIKHLCRSHLVERYSYHDGNSDMDAASSPNPDNDDVFGDHVYVVYMGENPTPVASSTSMAVGRSLMYDNGISTYDVVRTLRLPA